MVVITQNLAQIKTLQQTSTDMLWSRIVLRKMVLQPWAIFGWYAAIRRHVYAHMHDFARVCAIMLTCLFVRA